MEAKDTVLKLDSVNMPHLYGRFKEAGLLGDAIAIISEQAEISFKAGEQKVVDFLKAHPELQGYWQWKYIPEWQAFLKELEG